MFDPTAYENIRVVIEGAVYDRDLSGEILVIDRNDWFNAAKMSRKYEITFSLTGNFPSRFSGSITIEAGIENLAAELMETGNASQLAGCIVKIHFLIEHPDEPSVFGEIQEILESVWGRERVIEQTVQSSPFANNTLVKNAVTVSFNRLVYEHQIEDLAGMIDYMIMSLEKLHEAITI
ncbi:hypothetical protein [Bacillus sp. REN3]|uniref:hypothetical protein n=1 Tax=Bacillus sp. REN3 TaxID=2802440 RepID=UPI001AED6293|nr:hypothetical protein [Bacillus sp. REN3]